MADNTFKTCTPVCKVMLTKKIWRHNGVSQRAEMKIPRYLDITPFIDDSGYVSTNRSLYSPIGTFDIHMNDRGFNLKSDTELSPFKAFLNQYGFSFDGSGEPLDCLYGLIEPMDMIEIYMSGTKTNEPPIVMRGFVRDIARDESFDNNGQPMRNISVSGTCLGSAFDIYKICIAKELNTQGNTNLFMTDSDWAKVYGFNDGNPLPQLCGDFMQTMTNFINTKFMAALGYPDIKTSISVNDGKVLVSNISSYEGAFWGVMIERADTPWNELFIEDTKDATQLVYRPTPWVDLNNELCQTEPDGKSRKGLVKPVVINIPSNELKSLSVTRGDSRIFNYVSLDSSFVSLTGRSDHQRAMLNPLYQYFDYENNNPNIYGIRRLDAALYQVPESFAKYPAQQLAKEADKDAGDSLSYAFNRRRQLALMNADNVVLEDGSMIIKGNENVKCGMYISITRGKMINQYYVVGVTHSFVPFQSFTTTVDFIRGTGFVGRNRLETAPHLLESITMDNPRQWHEGEKVSYKTFAHKKAPATASPMGEGAREIN